jgi:DNA-binding response OmpR family regulator
METTGYEKNAMDEVFNLFDAQTDGAMKILIAEDDAITRRVLEATLNDFGFKVIATSNGDEACRALEGDEPAPLVILDLLMPGKDGLEVCKWIRASPRLKYTYVILLTTRSRTGDVVTGLQAGVDDYIVKPYDRVELRARIQVGMRVLAIQRKLSARICPNCGYSPVQL